MAAKRGDLETIGAGFVEKLLGRSHEIPLFLRGSLRHFAGPARVSLDDFFWVGGDDDPLHPFLADGLLAMVNRQPERRLFISRRNRMVATAAGVIPFIVREKGCTWPVVALLKTASLLIHPYSRDFHRSAQYRLHQGCGKSSDRLSRSCGAFRRWSAQGDSRKVRMAFTEGRGDVRTEASVPGEERKRYGFWRTLNGV